MEFYQWQTMFDEYRRYHRHDPRVKNLSDRDLYEIEVQNILNTSFKDRSNRGKRLMRLGAEYAWTRSGNPYYNVHPKMVESLCRTNLDKIPLQYVEIPDGLISVLFRFTGDVPIRYTDNSGFTVVTDESIKNSPIYCRAALFCRLDPQDVPDSETWEHEYQDHIHFFLVVDEGFRFRENGLERTLCSCVAFSGHPNETITEAIQNTIASLPKKHPTRLMMLSMEERLANLLRVIVSCGFLANSPEDRLVVPDVLSKDRNAYAEADRRRDQQRCQEIVARAHRRGKIGYNIGTNEMFVGESHLRQGSAGHTGQGQELTYSHIRSGHPHAVRYGEGKSKVKIKWFRPTRVRPDLPFKSG